VNPVEPSRMRLGLAPKRAPTWLWEPWSRGKIRASDGSYYHCANWLWRVLAALIDYPAVFILVAFALAIGDWINGLVG
jgi:hypothetical protein